MLDGKTIKMSKREWKRVGAAAKMCGKTRNAFVRDAAYQRALTTFIERNLRILENFVGDAFDNFILKMDKKMGIDKDDA